ncbi:ABC transporter permease [Nocardia sp. NBC_00403]|uniref:ABC transporter permease n=1 Tax=Nocardia sp. NBC_00403 TaxID=2975990 RepID=UPI002E224BFE
MTAPALVIQIGLFGAMFAGLSIVMELRAGVVERQRVTPASRAALLLIAVMAAGLAAASYALGLWAKAEDTLASVLNSITVPLMLLSGILLPMTLGPTWLQNIAKANPFSHTVDTARALFRGDFDASEVYLGSGLTVLVAVVLMVLGARSFARENA